jgi:hypothetical protein
VVDEAGRPVHVTPETEDGGEGEADEADVDEADAEDSGED